MARKNQNTTDKFWHDKHGRFVVWQKPNALLIVWFAAFVLTIFLSDGSLEKVVSLLGAAAILIWAVLELGWGADYFRRLLGLGVILLFVAARFL